MKDPAGVTSAMAIINKNKINKCGNCICGFDLEYRTGGGIPQLITIVVARNVFLLRLNKEGNKLYNGEKFPKCLVDFLTDKNFIKAGIGIAGDVSQLYTSAKIVVDGIVEITSIIKYHKLTDYYSSTGLGTLMKRVFNYKKRGSPSNWGCTEDYDTNQKIYASDDGIASLEVYNHLFDEFMKKQPSSKEFVSPLINKTVNNKEFNIYNKKKRTKKMKRLNLRKKESRIKNDKKIFKRFNKKKMTKILKKLAG